MADPVLRFAVGDPGGYSSNSWRVWVKPDGDAYIACRDNYQELKVSLHGNRWRTGLTAEGAEKTSHLRPPEADRAWMVWDRPDPVDGITMGFRILFLPSELAVPPSLRPTAPWRGVEFIPPADPGCVSIATITLNDEGREMAVAGSISQHHGFLPLSSGGRLQVTVHTEGFGQGFAETLAGAYRQGRELGQRSGIEVPPDGRMFLGGRGGVDASPFATEVNFHRPDPDPIGLSTS